MIWGDISAEILPMSFSSVDSPSPSSSDYVSLPSSPRLLKSVSVPPSSKLMPVWSSKESWPSTSPQFAPTFDASPFPDISISESYQGAGLPWSFGCLVIFFFRAIHLHDEEEFDIKRSHEIVKESRRQVSTSNSVDPVYSKGARGNLAQLENWKE